MVYRAVKTRTGHISPSIIDLQTSETYMLNTLLHYIRVKIVKLTPHGHLIKCKQINLSTITIKPQTRTSNSLILLDVTYRPIPIGMKMSPMTKKAGSTVPAVKMGCQAGKRCCLNAVLSGFLVLIAVSPSPADPG